MWWHIPSWRSVLAPSTQCALNLGFGAHCAGPLVKVCRIKHNWPLLASGATLVDLPRVYAANSVCARVAETYFKDCQALWFVTDIKYAVDNVEGVAKDLLWRNFRRQMTMDGLIGSISFVCTKSDSVSVEKVVEDLGEQGVCQRSGISPDTFQALRAAVTQAQEEEADARQRFEAKYRVSPYPCVIRRPQEKRNSSS